MGNRKERDCMSANVFDNLMVIALGVLAGTGIGLLIGFFAKKQKYEWSAMTRNDQHFTIALVIVFCVICIAGLAYYFLV
jgi:NADH:ubiquinone oxidoreductase subunit 5 (subunit L)/multisubunit Na+/H+ antiporter MnhA subunit